MSRRVTKGANIHVHLRVSHDMYLANHEGRGDPIIIYYPIKTNLKMACLKVQKLNIEEQLCKQNQDSKNEVFYHWITTCTPRIERVKILQLEHIKIIPQLK